MSAIVDAVLWMVLVATPCLLRVPLQDLQTAREPRMSFERVTWRRRCHSTVVCSWRLGNQSQRSALNTRLQRPANGLLIVVCLLLHVLDWSQSFKAVHRKPTHLSGAKAHLSRPKGSTAFEILSRSWYQEEPYTLLTFSAIIDINYKTPV